MARRGRKRQAGVRRTPSGRISEAKAVQAEMADRNVLAPAREARARHYGAGSEWRDQRYGSVVGRLAIAAVITPDQYDAAMRLLRAQGKALRAIDAPGAVVEPPDPERPPAGSHCGCTGSCREVAGCARQSATRRREQFDAARAAVASHCREQGSNLPWLAVDNIVLRDFDMPHLAPHLGRALDVLHRHFCGD